ncbi:MAG TPA: ABC transporter permease [Acidobacteriota bacterium]|nr:ABC transporter permease [Acidobacteriota bacterium]
MTQTLPLSSFLIEAEAWIERSNGSRDLTDPVLVQPASWNHVQTMGLHLVAGRWFRPSTAGREVAINMTMARHLAPTAQEALGRRVSLRSPDRDEWLDVVGVIDDVKTSGLTSASRSEIYIPYEFSSAKPLYVLVRTPLDPPALAEALAVIGKASGLDSWKPRAMAMSRHAHRS